MSEATITIWACQSGVVHLQSGAFHMALPAEQARRVAGSMLEAVRALAPLLIPQETSDSTVIPLRR